MIIDIIWKNILYMEVDKQYSKQMNRTWTSEGKFKLEWCQGFRQCIQVENRLKILELEKQKKIKDIQKKLEQHKKSVEIKIGKHNRHENIEKVRQESRDNISLCHEQFQASKRERSTNIKNLRASIFRANYQDFKAVKKEREQNNRIISQQKNIQIEEKTKKRNRVRLMEIQAKQNIVTSWNGRLQQMKQNRKKLLDKKIKEHQQNNIKINKMGKKEKKLLDQVFSSQKMEEELEQMILEENKMSGKELELLYKTS